MRTGRPAFDRAFGTPVWSYREQHPEANSRFNAFMADRARGLAAAVTASYGFPERGTIVDVGGGDGTLLAAVLRRYQGLSGVLLDQPHVAEHARATLSAAGVADRCRVLGGDFFAEVPAGGDVYILSTVLHDWSDDRATEILRRCRQAMTAVGRLVLVECVLRPGNGPSPVTLLDIQMMLIFPGGRERTENDWRTLLRAGGFSLQSIVRTQAIFDIVEAVPDRSP